MAGVITTGSNPSLLQDGVKNVFGSEYNRYPMQCLKLFDEESSEKFFEQDVLFEPFGAARLKSEGDSIAYDSAAQGILPRYNNYTYALGFIVTKENIRDERYGIFKKKAKMLARSMVQCQETIGANVYNNGFTSTFTMPGGDGKSLFATNHPNGGPDSIATFSNKLAVAAALSETSLESLTIQVSQATDPRGNRIALKCQKLIVPSALQYQAFRILKSTQQNDTANNATNALRDMGVLPEIMINNYLTSSTAWFIKTDCMDGLKFMNRQAVEFDQDMDFGTSDTRFKADQRYSFGWSDPRGGYGSEGV